jgi:hypothetical protein
MGSMNIFSALFGIFRQRGLVLKLQEGRPLSGFALSAFLLSVVGGVLYGFAMGIGLGPETAIKDAIKVGLIVTLGLLFALPIFWLAYRLLGREERLAQVAAVPLTFVATAAIVLAVTAPIVFMLSLLAGFSPEGVYIHIVIVDLALLVGLYLAGTLIYHGFTADRAKLIVPNVVGFLMLGVILVVLMLFFSPFLALDPTFSVGTDLLNDRLGIGVGEKALQALDAAAVADRVTYGFQTTNQNGDLERDYTVTRLGQDYLVEIHLHAVPGQVIQANRRIWILDGEVFTDFADGRVTSSDRTTLTSFLNPALPPAVFRLPDDFASASWRGLESGGLFTAVGVTPSRAQAKLVLSATILRLSGLVLGSVDRGLHAEIRVNNLQQAVLDRARLVATLNQAIVLGSVDRSDASLQDYVQEAAFFIVRFPRTWHSGNWNAAQRQVTFTSDCGAAEGCPQLTVAVFDLAENKGAKEYGQDLGDSLSRQPEYREVKASTTTIGDRTAGVVEYLFDRTVKGQIQTTHHIEYIFIGSLTRYHLDFLAPAERFEANRGLFEAMAGVFAYLGYQENSTVYLRVNPTYGNF